MHPKVFEVYKKRIDHFLAHSLVLSYTEEIPFEATIAVTKDWVDYKDRLKLKYHPVREGETWGHSWDSAWLHITAKVPASFAGKELCLRLQTGGETLLFDAKGTPIFGLTAFSIYDHLYTKERYCIGKHKKGETIDYWCELAANHLFGLNRPDAFDPQPARESAYYDATMKYLRLSVFDREMWNFRRDMMILNELLECYTDEHYQGKQLLAVLTKAMDIYAHDPKNAPKARAYLAEHYFKTHPAVPSALTAAAIGHAHIDCGWLWPTRESTRKAARTFASQIDNIERYPTYKFGASQAYLYSVIKERYPELYKKIKKYIKDGRWEVQGGMWVEADCNITSGESLVRQFLYGKNFFMDEFGVDVKNLWIPDVFGYSASLPQIIKKSACDYFLTQKISWSQFNTFPHHTFLWEGIDGTRVLTHFCPENTYNANATPKQRMEGQDRYQQAAVAPQFLSLIGIGDGGGGPSDEYIENNLRVANLEGCPKSEFKFARDFFDEIACTAPDLPVWVGELYLELHRGTLTTQARTKRGNRKCEEALTALEILASGLKDYRDYPQTEIDNAWRTLLLNQFHDILPGSSIREVYEVTEKEHADILKTVDTLTQKIAPKLFKKEKDALLLVNTLPTIWEGVIPLPDGWENVQETHLDVSGFDSFALVQKEADGRSVLHTVIPPQATLTLHKSTKKAPLAKATKSLVMENDFVRYTFNKDGQLISAIDKKTEEEFLSAPGNVFSLYNDRPACWDAWEVDIYYHDHDRIEPPICTSVGKVMNGPARQTLELAFKTANSTIHQRVSLAANSRRLDFETTVDWHEKHKMLRVAFPTSLHSDQAMFDIQYGMVSRPTHDNTSWDEARFETVGQKFAALKADDREVAVLNDCKYGYRVKGQTIDLALLRSPMDPDRFADQGEHVFTYSFFLTPSEILVPCYRDLQCEAKALNRPPIILKGYKAAADGLPIRSIDSENCIEVIKKAQKSNDTIVRLVETTGHATAIVLTVGNARRVSYTNLVEWEHGDAIKIKHGMCMIPLKPFEIVTLRVER